MYIVRGALFRKTRDNKDHKLYWALAGYLLLALLGAGCAEEKTAHSESALPVSLYKVGEKASAESYLATGVVRFRQETPLAFLADGRVRSVEVDEGQTVSAGKQLARLDHIPQDATVAASKARLLQAEAELARQADLYKKGWIARARVETATALTETARAELRAAQFSQDYSRINAPARGVILKRLVEPGQAVAAGTPALIIGEYASGYVVRVPVSAAVAQKLKLQDRADIIFRDGSAPDMAGRVVEIAARADPASATFPVEIVLPAHDGLRSGMIADVRFATESEGGLLSVPATSVFAARAGEGFVWLFNPKTKRAQAQLVRLGRIGGKSIEIVSGLGEGQHVVASGVDRIVEGRLLSPETGAQKERGR